MQFTGTPQEWHREAEVGLREIAKKQRLLIEQQTSRLAVIDLQRKMIERLQAELAKLAGKHTGEQA